MSLSELRNKQGAEDEGEDAGRLQGVPQSESQKAASLILNAVKNPNRISPTSHIDQKTPILVT